MISAKISKIEEGRVTLALPDGQSLAVPTDALEGQPAEGLSANIIVAVPGAEDAARQKLAKHLLNELVGQ